MRATTYCQKCKKKRPYEEVNIMTSHSFRGLKLWPQRRITICRKCGHRTFNDIDSDELKKAYWKAVAIILSK